MSGWKTKTGAVLIGISGILPAFWHSPMAAEIANTLLILGNALGVVGLGHKIEKAS